MIILISAFIQGLLWNAASPNFSIEYGLPVIRHLSRYFFPVPLPGVLCLCANGCLEPSIASRRSAKASQCSLLLSLVLGSMETSWLGGGTGQVVVGRAGQSLAALQNPFLHSPVAGRLGQSQTDVPSQHKAPKLQVGPIANACRFCAYDPCL